MIKFTKPHVEHRRELLEDLTDLRDSAKERRKGSANASICFAWDRELSSEDLLDALEATGQVVSSVCFDAEDAGILFHVLAYSKDEVITRDEASLKKDFLALLNTVILP